ncbi:hypothetical protein [Mucilaginibacter sp. PAMB04168]|uniref:hypothetical protein n=1 Tax=Mucilaginibacter sp. PAMB04168 TaxID=3138567 RepID=UPI0031F6F037
MDKNKLEVFFKFIENNATDPIEDEDLNAVIEGAGSWDFKVTLINYFFTSFLQRRINSGDYTGDEINLYYRLTETGNYDYQEFNRDFIEYLFSYSRSKMTMNLEEILIHVQQDFSDNNYASTFRY